MTNDVDLFQPLHEKIETMRRYGKDAEQLTVRISSELRTALKRIAKKQRIKEGAMHRALLEWAIEAYAQSSQRQDVLGEQLVRSEQLEVLERISLLGDELTKLREQIAAKQDVDKCKACLVREEMASLKSMLELVVKQADEYRSHSDGELFNGIHGVDLVKR